MNILKLSKIMLVKIKKTKKQFLISVIFLIAIFGKSILFNDIVFIKKNISFIVLSSLKLLFLKLLKLN